MRLKIGTRKSKLALIQTNLVIDKISQLFPEIDCEIVPIVTSGDKITDKNLYDIGGKALFLKEIEQALLDKKIDLAVHSLKDVPGRLPEELEISAVLEREDPRDVFISTKYNAIQDLPLGSVVGSSSVRRRVYINRLRPDIEVVMFRGNVDTRLARLMEGQVEATVLAAAGLTRMGVLNSEYCFPINPDEILPAVGQGVIAIETVQGDSFAREVCVAINHVPTWEQIQPERAFIEHLDASCRTPLAAYTTKLEGSRLHTKFMLSNFTGDYILTYEEIDSIDQGKAMGYRAAEILLRRVPA